MVFASRPVVSVIRFAALPVGAASRIRRPFFSRMRMMPFTSVVFPSSYTLAQPDRDVERAVEVTARKLAGAADIDEASLFHLQMRLPWTYASSRLDVRVQWLDVRPVAGGVGLARPSAPRRRGGPGHAWRCPGHRVTPVAIGNCRRAGVGMRRARRGPCRGSPPRTSRGVPRRRCCTDW